VISRGFPGEGVIIAHRLHRSWPPGRCGSIGDFVAIDRLTGRLAASSAAIWNPELPPPTTSTGPSGTPACRAVVAA
jgi:hypothetical protein